MTVARPCATVEMSKSGKFNGAAIACHARADCCADSGVVVVGDDCGTGTGVVIGAGAKILGPITLGNNVRVGSNSVVVRSIDDNETVVGIPGRIVRKKAEDTDSFDSYAANSSGLSNDPTLQTVNSLIDRLADVEEKLNKVSSKKSTKNIE